jgi:hypothetical protein
MRSRTPFARSVLVPAFLPLAAAALLAVARPAAAETDARAGARPVDLAIALDTSGSMEGLIDAARRKIWSVVSELATAKPAPRLRVALFTYGSLGNDDSGHVVLQTDFTDDLDFVSERLFGLTTNGGDEYVGRVIGASLDRLSWSRAEGLKVLFVAGNESADQDRVRPFREEAKRAAARGIVVNAIYCGGADDADATGWRETAALGHGRFANIDQNGGTLAVATPFDAELAGLSARMNETYVAYGDRAAEGLARQRAQDENASGAGAPSAAERANAKAGGLYRNGAWDLVDRMREADFDLAKIPASDLPEEMRKMTMDERRAFLEKKKAERDDIQARIKDLGEKRQKFVDEAMAQRRLDDSKALDRALLDALREQAAAAGFTFNK